MAKVMQEYFTKPVVCSDIEDYGYPNTKVSNFLSQTIATAPKVNLIMTNPPFNLALQFIEKALELVDQTDGVVAMLLRNEFDCASSRTHLFENHLYGFSGYDLQLPFSKKLVLTKRPRWIEGSTGSPRHNYAWYIWDTAHEGAPQIVYGQ